MEEAICFANGDIDGVRADVFVDLGDRVQQQGLRAENCYWGAFNDVRSLMSLSKVFNALERDVLRVHLDGNHDGALSPVMTEALLTDGLDYPIHTGHGFLDTDHVRLLFWNANIRNSESGAGYVASDRDVVALQMGLLTSRLPVVMFNHIALDMSNTPQFQNESGELVDFYHPFYRNGELIKDTIAEAGNVVLAMSGHIHRYKKPAPVPATCLDAVIEATQYLRLPAVGKDWSRGAFTVLDIDSKEIDVRVLGDFSRRQPWQGDAPEPFSLALPQMSRVVG